MLLRIVKYNGHLIYYVKILADSSLRKSVSTVGGSYYSGNCCARERKDLLMPLTGFLILF